jgi:hypothetical protein
MFNVLFKTNKLNIYISIFQFFFYRMIKNSHFFIIAYLSLILVTIPNVSHRGLCDKVDDKSNSIDSNKNEQPPVLKDNEIKKLKGKLQKINQF